MLTIRPRFLREPPVVFATEDNYRLSARWNLEQLLSLVDPRDIDVQIVDADWNEYGQWVITLRIQWRGGQPEDTGLENSAILLQARIIEVEGFVD